MKIMTDNEIWELENDMEDRKEFLIKEIFDTVYQWGRIGIKTDHKAPTYRKLFKQLKFYI